MALTWLTKTKQYFTTKVFTEDRFRTGDKPTEAEYSNLFQSIVFKVHDLATTLLAGIVRKATKLDFLLGLDEKPTTLAGYTHNDPLYVSPKLMQEFVLPAGSITSWIPFRAFNRITGQRFVDNAGTILDTGFLGLGVGGTVVAVANADWYNGNVVDFFERNYLSPRYRICDGRVITFINPYTNLLETVQLPDMRGRITRGGHILPNTAMQDNQGVFAYGGTDVQNLSHTHTINSVDIQNALSIEDTPITLITANLPLHNHEYTLVSVSSFTSNAFVPASGTPITYVVSISTSATPAFTSAVGGNAPFVHNHDLIVNSDIETQIENPADPFFPDFSEVDNRQRYFNTYYIMAIY